MGRHLPGAVAGRHRLHHHHRVRLPSVQRRQCPHPLNPAPPLRPLRHHDVVHGHAVLQQGPGRGHRRESGDVRLQSAVPGGRVHADDRRVGDARVEYSRRRPGVLVSVVARRPGDGHRPGELVFVGYGHTLL